MRATFAAVLLLATATGARADLEICNLTSFVIETALGIESKGSAATRGWFRIDPGVCRTVLRGEVSAGRLLVHARALALYGALKPLNETHVQLCTGAGDFLIAGANKCAKPSDRMLPFAEVKPRKTESGFAITVAESADYDETQARFAAIQRLLTLAGFDAEPVDGVPGAKSEMALAAFLKSRALNNTIVARAEFIDLLLDAARDGAAPGLLWCNDTRYRVLAALALEEGREIVTRGWWQLEPGACLRPELPRRFAGSVLTFAEAVDSSGAPAQHKGRALNWGGTRRLCVKNTRFEIREHDNCPARGLESKGFTPVEISVQGGATLRFREP
ncbi:MAG: DUF1036 domain-containing protein [Xanthobacteraceae bacterium]|nr:DUF1036 domain-containing protein [Xanthobacteraceae bacterium]QYK45309.1 MAG: DUF1036 domain-containing protein [Xanthobacteraceae bacterium]